MTSDERLQGLHGLIFDLDGTLYCQAPLRRKMRNRLLISVLSSPIAGIREIRIIQAFRKAQEHLRRLEQPIQPSSQVALAAEWAKVSQASVDEVVTRWMDEAPLAHLGQSIQPGLSDFLTKASNRGLHMGVLSDYPPKRKLEALGIAHYFKFIACAQDEQVCAFKPSPKGLLALLAQMGLQPDEALYVGDRIEVDGEAARRAGMIAAIIGISESKVGENWFGIPSYDALWAKLAER